MNVKEAFISRRSVRRFLPDPISKDKIKNILECSAFAPSGHNIQPWHVYVVEGEKKQAITNSILESIKMVLQKILNKNLIIIQLSGLNHLFLEEEQLVLSFTSF